MLLLPRRLHHTHNSRSRDARGCACHSRCLTYAGSLDEQARSIWCQHRCCEEGDGQKLRSESRGSSTLRLESKFPVTRVANLDNPTEWPHMMKVMFFSVPQNPSALQLVVGGATGNGGGCATGIGWRRLDSKFPVARVANLDTPTESPGMTRVTFFGVPQNP